MNTVQRITKNASVLLGADIIGKILSFLYLMYMARHLGAEGYGILSFALAFTGIFGIFTDLGLKLLTIREVARDKSLASKYLANIIAMKVVLVTFVFGLIALTINLLGYPRQTIEVVYLVAMFVILQTFAHTFYSIFHALEKMEYVSLGQIIFAIPMLVGVSLAIRYSFSVVGFACVYVAVSVIELGYTFALTRLKFCNAALGSAVIAIEFDWSFWKRCIREAWPMGAMAVCTVIYYRIDMVMLSLMKGETAVGLYGAAFKLSEISTIIPTMFMLSVFPVMSKYHKDSRRSFIRAYEKSIRYLLYIALPMALGVTLLARPIINVIFGNEFSGSIVALQIVIWAAASTYLTVVVGTALVTANRQMTHLKLAFGAAILNVSLNLIVIPKYGYVGASATTVATRASIVLVGIFLLNRFGYRFHMIEVIAPPLFAFCGSVVAAMILAAVGINVLVISMVAVVTYGVVIYKTGITQDDKQLFKKLLSLPNIKASQEEAL